MPTVPQGVRPSDRRQGPLNIGSRPTSPTDICRQSGLDLRPSGRRLR
jgi:hypothetical protein